MERLNMSTPSPTKKRDILQSLVTKDDNISYPKRSVDCYIHRFFIGFNEYIHCSNLDHYLANFSKRGNLAASFGFFSSSQDKH